MSFQPINPKPLLRSLVSHKVVVRLKFNDIEYHGTLSSTDNYMNLLLASDVEEVNAKTQEKTALGDELFIRCNNVLWISEEKRAADAKEASQVNKDDPMES